MSANEGNKSACLELRMRRDELDEILSEDRGCRYESGGGGELIRYKRENGSILVGGGIRGGGEEG